MKLERIEELKEVCLKATPGPWTGSSNIPFYAILDKPAPSLSKHDTPTSPHWRIADAVFVSVARDALPEALDEVLRLRMELNKLTDIVDSSLLLDEHLAEAWGTLRDAVVASRKSLE